MATETPKDRNIYLNGSYEEAVRGKYDIIQLKLDGWWCRALHHAHESAYFSETGRSFATASAFPDLTGCILIGEFMRGTQWSTHPSRHGRFFVYDIWAAFGEPITTESYATRYRLLRKLHLPSTYSLVDCYSLDSFDDVWQRYVLDSGYEGVVFRRSGSQLGDAVLRCKREFTLDGTVVGFDPGLGKYEGTLGAVRFLRPNGNVDPVGTGFDDKERDDIWRNRPKYLGRVGEYTANAIFESGAIRHGRFVRWREDKV